MISKSKLHLHRNRCLRFIVKILKQLFLLLDNVVWVSLLLHYSIRGVYFLFPYCLYRNPKNCGVSHGFWNLENTFFILLHCACKACMCGRKFCYRWKYICNVTRPQLGTACLVGSPPFLAGSPFFLLVYTPPCTLI